MRGPVVGAGLGIAEREPAVLDASWLGCRALWLIGFAAYNLAMATLEVGLAVGQRVKFTAPLNDDERDERFTVLELRGERVLVEFICDMNIRPTFAYSPADLVPADE